MAASKELHLQLSRDQQRLLEEWLLEFEQNWSRTALDNWHDRVNSQPDPFPLAAVIELIKIDIERRWQADDRVSIDWYLDRFAVLKSNSSFPLDLLEAEIEVRRQFGDAVELEQLLDRYPNRADEIRQVFNAAATQCAAETSHAPGKTPKQNRNSGPNATEDNLQPGRTFGRYHILQKLGAGAMGKVLLAEDTVLGRQVALKIPHFSGSRQHEILDRFQREARAAATIDHPNICPIYDVGVLDGVNFLSMAYIDGHPLSAYVSEKNQLQNRAVAILVRKLALGLAAAHQKGIVHRDLKPDNIMIKRGSEPIVMDFGLAFSQETRAESRVTQEGALLGSPAYMSVEQVEGRIGDVGPRSDIYSLGVILYELLTGELPFQGNVTAVISQILSQTPQPPRERRHDVEPELESICLKMMSKLPDDRHADMKAVADDLTHYLKEASKHDAPATIGGNDHTIAPQAEQTSLNTERLENSDMPANTAAEFDPYHKWLGIPPREQPPNHYRLLAIDLFETDLDVIDAAATKQITYVRQCATGPHAAASQQVLNDLSTAQICLLDPQKKSAYDAKLKAELNAQATAESAPPLTSASTDTVTSGQKVEQPVDPKLAQQTKKLDKQKKQIESLLEKCEFAAAVAALEKMAAVKSPKLAKYAKWAKLQLPKAKSGTQDMRESSAAMYRTASDLFDRHDYEEAAEILQQIPQKFRNSEISKLLQECLDLQEEVADLQEDIDRAESLKKYDDLQPTVERLLEIKPNDRRAKKLLKELKTYGKGGGMRLGGRGDGRFDAAGDTSNPLKVALLVVVPLVLFGAISWATVIYLRSNDQTIKIEIDDPSAQVVIDGETVKITGVGDTIKLKPGKHELVVERGDVMVHTREFEVLKGKNPVLRITLDEMAVTPATPTGIPPAVATTSSGSAPPRAVAPFDTATAKKHQQAWANYLDMPIETTNSIGMKFKLIPPGEFTMGSAQEEIDELVKTTSEEKWKDRFRSEGPPHRVALSKPFYLGVYETTQAEYRQVMGNNPSYFSPGGDGMGKVPGLDTDRFPVELVNWFNAVSFCNALSEREGLKPCYERKGDSFVITEGDGYRLPREVEWEFSCRAGTVTRWSFGDSEDQMEKFGIFAANCGGRTHAVGEFRPNPFGLYDMHGNVYEWCEGWHTDYEKRKAAVTTDPPRPVQGVGRELRGGSFHNEPINLRSAYRNHNAPGYIFDGLGFRVARTVKIPAAAIRPQMPADNASQPAAAPLITGTRTFTGHTGRVNAVAVSPDGTRIASGGEGRTIRVWDTTSGEELMALKAVSRVTALAFSPDGKQIANGSGDVQLWDAATGKDLGFLGGHKGTVYGVAFSSDGRQFASASINNTLKTWDAATGKELRTITEGSSTVTGYGCVAFSPDGKHLVTGANGGPEVKIWNAETGEETRTLSGHTKRIGEVCYSPNGKWIATGSYDGTIKVWDVATGQNRHTIEGHFSVMHGVAFSPDSRFIVGPSNDKTVKLWDVLTGQEVQSTTAHTANYVSVAFSPDGTWVVASAEDGTVRAWDVKASISGIESSPSTPITNLPPPPISPAEIAALNRKVAEWALRRGGTIGTDMGSFKAADALPQQSFQIYDVTLSGKQVTNDDLSSLSGLVSLTHLRLDNTAIGNAGLSSLRGLTKLRVLLLSGTQISDAGLSNLQGLTNLESLYLGDTSIRGDGLVHLQGMTKLVDLRLANTNINDAALSHLQGLTSLNVLHLNSKDVTDAGMSHLKGLTNLKNLVINNTGVSDTGLANLKGMTDLEVLFLGNTPIVGDGLEHLQGLKKLTQLRLGSTQLTDENLVHLSSLTGLTDLRINNNRIGDEGLTHLNRLTKLKTLACDNTQVSDVGLDNIKKLKQLTTIYLQNTKVTANGVAALRQSLPQCDIKH